MLCLHRSCGAVLTETVPSCCDKYERNWHFLKRKLKRKNWDINILFLREEYRWLYGWLLQTQNCLLVCIFRRQHQRFNHYILRPILISATGLSSWSPWPRLGSSHRARRRTPSSTFPSLSRCSYSELVAVLAEGIGVMMMVRFHLKGFFSA